MDHWSAQIPKELALSWLSDLELSAQSLPGIVGLTLEVLRQLDKAAVTNQQPKMPQAARWEIKTS